MWFGYFLLLFQQVELSHFSGKNITFKVNKNNNNNNNNNSLYFQRVTHLARKKKLILHEALYKLPPKNNASYKNTKMIYMYTK